MWQEGSQSASRTLDKKTCGPPFFAEVWASTRLTQSARTAHAFATGSTESVTGVDLGMASSNFLRALFPTYPSGKNTSSLAQKSPNSASGDFKCFGYLLEYTDETREQKEKHARATNAVLVHKDATPEERAEAEARAEEAWNQNGRRASWGCAWYKAWLSKVAGLLLS